MNWEAVGAVGQAVSAFALIFVLVQVRHARQAMQLSVRQMRMDVARERTMQYIDNERLNSLNVRAIDALSGDDDEDSFVDELIERVGMTREEAWTVSLDQSAWWMYRVQIVAQVHHLPRDERTEFDDVTRSLYRTHPLASLWYTHSRATLVNRKAVRYVDNLLAQPG